MSEIESVTPKPILKRVSEEMISRLNPILKNSCVGAVAKNTTPAPGSVDGGILKRKSFVDSSNETISLRPDTRIKSSFQGKRIHFGLIKIRFSKYFSIEFQDDLTKRKSALRTRKPSYSLDETLSSPEHHQSILKKSLVSKVLF